MTNTLPSAKTENIVIQSLEGELLIYDLIKNNAYCLNETAAAVYKACDGATTFESLKAQNNFTDELIFLALDNLNREDLITGDFVPSPNGMNRREIIRILGKTSLLAMPIISSIAAPTPAMAASTCSGTLAPGTILGCTQTEPQCLAMFQMCASCSTSAVITVGPGACDAANPFLCTCS